jgi:predicted nucleic-acid-binding protein
VQDDATQGQRSQVCLSAQPVYIPGTVILELERVLRSRCGYSPKTIADAMERLAIPENAVVGEQAAHVAAAKKLRQSWDFTDALHHALAAGCDEFATFDTSLSRRAGRDDLAAPSLVAI